MKKFTLFLLILLSSASAKAQSVFNMTLKGQKTYTSSLASVWGWHDGNGREYALVGVNPGLSIVDVTDPYNPVEVQFIPTAASNWHEIKTWQHYAYCVNENVGGTLIVDLSGLPGSVSYVHDAFQGYVPDSTGHYFQTAHTVTIDENGFMWLNGQGWGGAFVFDLNTNPMNPDLVGLPIHYPSPYIHDSYVRNNIMYSAEIYNGTFRIMDVTVKNAPVTLAVQNTPWNFTHNVWPSDNGQTLFATDEVTGSYVTSYDISDLNNITELDRFAGNPGSGSVPHNVHVKNDYLVIAHYRDGVIIADANRPSNIIKVGAFDTYSQGSGGGFNGCWGVYPYLPSGNILASDISNGLFVLGASYNRASYLEGIVSDSVSGLPMNGVTVTLLSATGAQPSVTPLTGKYSTGVAGSGNYTVTFSKAGYITKSFSVNLTAGQVTTLNTVMQLQPVCGTPAGLAATNITKSSATLNWSNVSASSYLVSWKRVGASGTSTATVTGTSHNISGLQSCRQHQFSVRANCPGGTTYTSAWAYFTTTGRGCRIAPDGNVWYEESEPEVYPNPFRNNLQITLWQNETTSSKVEVHDVTGKMIAVVFDGLSDEGETTIDYQASSLAPGWYFIRVTNGEEVFNFRVLKQ